MISKIERDFVRALLTEKCRLDGRGAFEYRPIKISFEKCKGCCIVDLGKTKVCSLNKQFCV